LKVSAQCLSVIGEKGWKLNLDERGTRRVGDMVILRVIAKGKQYRSPCLSHV